MNAPSHTTHVPVVIVGGGQAGLSVSHHLKKLGIDHLVLEKNRVGHSWRNDRWDTFCLVTPNWQCRLPDYPYQGTDPKGFMLKDEIVAYLEGFARMVDPPIREGVSVTRVGKGPRGGFEVETSEGRLTADHVVVATGGYDVPIVPPYAHALTKDVAQIHSVDYRNPDQLPPGEVLVVGSGQSGVQIMEDLYLAGRQVHLCVGPAPRSPRQYRGKDATEWLMEMGYYELTIDRHPQGEKAKEKTNHYMSGRAGGHEIDLRRFALQGVKLYGSIAGMDGATIRFADDLAKNLDDADEVYVSIRRDIDKYIAAQGIDAPEEPPFVPVWTPRDTPTEIDAKAAGIGAIVWAIGFRPNYAWIDLPAFDGRGAPKFTRGVSPVEGLYFIGLPWLNTWGSGRFLGVADDAQFLAGVMSERLHARKSAAA
ncbi:MSMEG_0569 family flavin-dependent oxidoreductase [Azospirillum rugosum]|uniref:Flavoprotein involved in K+ transport n=1 Tax=Azospirillum rugosum TaxID=416170 RepID=A0ABS4SMD8_9PROT|nr:MSMEG_0569 family flavin-dependent oxidoreductase [Azospirillum rugosum]MBP2293730.1 putative flavoprotein involved in K+ transport [Azospirillum rugosum]MDQ0527275.1 putative flavoprotein involved in K+ transport [Azospirillum rugosum]